MTTENSQEPKKKPLGDRHVIIGIVTLLLCVHCFVLFLLFEISQSTGHLDVALIPKQHAYDYKIQFFPDSSSEQSMDRLGKDGWELVHAHRAKGNSGYECIFKRSIQ